MFCSLFLYSFKYFSDLLFFATLWFSIKVIETQYIKKIHIKTEMLYNLCL